MKISKQNDEFHILLPHPQLGTLNNCLNEVLEITDAAEFRTRVGATRSKIKGLLQQISDAYDELPGG